MADSDSTTLKRCSRCGEYLPPTSEYFYPDKRNSSQLRADCKLCNRANGKQYRKTNPEKARESVRRTRNTKSPEYKRKKREYMRRWHSEHRDITRARCKNWRTQNIEVARQSCHNWRLANPEKVASYTRNRKARLRDSEGTHTAADVQAQLKRQKGMCYYCGAKVGNKYHVDHVVPVTRNGSNDPSNLVIACPICNIKKSDKLPHEWPEGGRLL
jgi:5-methylcytosine-specific restriction endonuclease McrA